MRGGRKRAPEWRLSAIGRVGYVVLLHDSLQGDEEKDQARGDLQHQHGNGKVVEHLLAKRGGDSDGGAGK